MVLKKLNTLISGKIYHVLFILCVFCSCKESKESTDLLKYNNTILEQDIIWMFNELEKYALEFPDENKLEKETYLKIKEQYELILLDTIKNIRQVHDSIDINMKKYLATKGNSDVYAMYVAHVDDLNKYVSLKESLYFNLFTLLKVRENLILLMEYSKRSYKPYFYGSSSSNFIRDIQPK